VATVIALLLLVSMASADRPNRELTPGVTRPISRTAVCSTRWGLDRRHVTEAMRKQVFTNYGIPYSQHRSYELDHDVPRELGGSDDVRNLWPQPLAGKFNAHEKDRLENALHKLVCAGEMSLEFAQQAIVSDWIAAYRLYVAPRLARDDVPESAKGHSVIGGERLELLALFVAKPDEDYIGRREFSAESAFTNGRIAASLRVTVARIVKGSSEKQVVWSHAWRHVASMQNASAVRNKSVRQYP
jgi:hypothetical protein